MTLSEYLRNRGLSFDPVEIDKGLDPILGDEMLIKEAAELWESKSPLIRLVLQARINSIAKLIIEKCPPEEVLVLRQAIVELGAIESDFEAYKGEYGRREANKNKDNKVAEAVQVPPKEGAESSL